ncbi:GAF domain-containing protein [Actinophytocola oryzae]|uniref:ANTAR domain-containing protein n=1 Tax=Actinophytocola oryzae TaxID=502181 RepID=A0A4V6Q708_9PSEU|nr:GAF domain-containing protein [Actinophytocola oryzae]TDV57641.1 ANTAR domain-containing protein [Actinophytocola oryzae]
MDERRNAGLWRLVAGGSEDDDVWDRVRLACEIVVHHVNVDAAAVTIVCGEFGVVMATDEWADRLEDYQHTLGEGPGVEVVRSGLAVLVPDTRARRHLWPAFSEGAVAGSLAAVFAFPVTDTDANTIGALTLYRRSGGALTSRELRHVAVMVGFVAKLIELNDGPLDVNLKQDRYTTISAATKLLANRHEIDPNDALALLRAHAYAHDRPLNAIAAAVLTEELWSTSLDDD